jgi:hypothetical protein
LSVGDIMTSMSAKADTKPLQGRTLRYAVAGLASISARLQLYMIDT